ncbi:uncharacterized protein V6R79_013885 [Siganus canaliculatus]
MIHLVLMFTLAIKYVDGRPPLPPLPMKDGCYLVSPEVQIFRLEGEAIILSFPMFDRVIRVRNIAPPSAKYVITKANGTEGVAFQAEGRVQQSGKQLWFLPAKASDSGEYICSYRNDTYCVSGSIRLQVYESSSVDMEKLSYPISVMVGEERKLRCPSISDFSKTDRQTVIEWHKDPSLTEHELDREDYIQQDRNIILIPAVKLSHAGLYTCQLKVLINNQQYNVSRTILLRVEGIEASPTVPDLHVTSSPGLVSSSTSKTVHTPVSRPPVIVSPLNGTIYQSAHGSGLEVFCEVLTECEVSQSTMVMWLVNDQSLESSYLDGRALQGGRRVTRVSEGCQIELRLILVAVTEEDVKTELKCVSQNRGGRQEVVTQLQLEDSTFTWLAVAVVAASCFLTVVSIFLYVLFKPKNKKKMDYILARQNSTF